MLGAASLRIEVKSWTLISKTGHKGFQKAQSHNLNMTHASCKSSQPPLGQVNNHFEFDAPANMRYGKKEVSNFDYKRSEMH